jgi:hypothetical protein
MTQHDFIPLLQVALKEAAKDIPEDTNLLPRIRKQVLAEHILKKQPVSLWRKRSLALTSSFLVAAIVIFSGFTFAMPVLFNWLGDASLQQITLDHATLINREVTIHGITLHLDQAYADAARIAVTYHVTSSSSVSPFPAVLTDELHQAYPSIMKQQINNQSLEEYVPLAPNMLNHQHTLTFTVTTMIIRNSNGRAQETLSGLWKISFPLQPLIGSSIKLITAPYTKHEVSMEPLQVNFAPSGARLLLQIHGLAPNTSLNTLAQFATHAEISGISPNNHIGSDSWRNTDGTLLQLRLPDGHVLVPAAVQLWDRNTNTTLPLTGQERSVGINGAVTLQVLFFTTLPVSHQTAQLTIDQLRVAPVSAKGYTTVTGPWTFPILLQRP